MGLKVEMTDYNVMKDLTFDSRDEFSRRPIAEKIIKLLDSNIDVSPLIIDGKWGTGKTEFCFKLKNLIEDDESNNYKVGYVNAFQADHANEPLLALIAEVAGFYGEKDDKRKNFIKDAIPYLRLVSGIGLKAGLGFAFGRYAADIPDALTDGFDEIKDGSKSLIDQSLESMIKDQVEAEKNLSTLRNALTDIASTKPVVLLIDELDRCRPDFAIMMLETIKHVFDVDNVQILLVTNAEQLKATIKHSYGSETDSHSYLYKFFKYQISLPTTAKNDNNEPQDNNIIYFRKVIQDSRVIPQEFKDNEYIYETSRFLNLSKLSLRNIEQIVRCVETLVVFEDKERSQSPAVEQILIVLLSFIYKIDNGLLNEIIKKEVDASKLYGFISASTFKLPQHYNENNVISVRELIIIVFNRYLTSDHLTLPSEHWTNRDAVMTLRKNLDNYELKDSVNNIIGMDFQYSSIHEYIDHTVNNLMFFDIVK